MEACSTNRVKVFKENKFKFVIPFLKPYNLKRLTETIFLTIALTLTVAITSTLKLNLVIILTLMIIVI